MKQKRTKRYGGFLVGDRVKFKEHLDYEMEVVGLSNGYIVVEYQDSAKSFVRYSALPCDFINLTRQEEKERMITFSPSDLPDTSLELL